MSTPDEETTAPGPVMFARSGQSDVFGKLDCELPTLRFNSDADFELERRWRASGLGSRRRATGARVQSRRRC